MTATAVLTLHDQVVAAIKGIATLAGGKVYNTGEIPAQSPLPYAVIGTWAEPSESRRSLSQKDLGQVAQITWWGVNRKQALQAFSAGKTVLDGVTLALTGHRMLQCSLGLLAEFKEPAAPAPQLAAHAVVSQLRTRTVET